MASTTETALWAIVIVVTAVWVYGLNLVQRWRYRHIPGPPPKWLLGNAAEIQARMMHGSYEQWAKKYGPVCRIFMGMRPLVIITDPDLMKEVTVRQFMTFHDRPPWPLPTANSKIEKAIDAWMVQAQGSYWTSLRAAAQPLFHSDRLASFAPSMLDAAEEQAVILAQAADAGEPVDMLQHLARISLNTTGLTVFGLDFKLQAAGQQGIEMPMIAAWKRMFNITLSPVMVAKAVLPTALQPLVMWLAAALGEKNLMSHEDTQTVTFESSTALMDNAWRDLEKRGVKVTAEREPGWRWWQPGMDPMQGVVPSENSLISLLLRATNKETGRGLTDKQVAAQVNTFMAAGYETTSTALTFAVALLARYPEVERKLVMEIDALGGRDLTAEDVKHLPYTEAVLCEAMRLYPPLPIMGRVANKATQVGGYRLPSGAIVHYSIWGIQRDARYWPDPCAFRPERFLSDAGNAGKRHPNAFLAFGLGPRACIGQKFAMQEAILVLARLYRDVSFELLSDQPLELREGLTIAPKHGLHVRVVRRKKTA